MIEIDKHFGRYKIESKIGEGGMSKVFLAKDTELGRFVALKVLPSEVSDDSERVIRFLQEAKAASALNHPNILIVHEIDKIKNIRFIVSEYIQGETLRNKLQKQSLNIKGIINIAIQIASALQTAHNAGIIHRDIKPENIMVREDELIKILDFGLVKLIKEDEKDFDENAKTQTYFVTKEGKILGTTAYMSPEQTRGHKVDERTDIWSLGVVLFEMLTRKRPFVGETGSDLIAAILTNKTPLVSSYLNDFPKEVEDITYKCLQKKRENRYQKVEDILFDLKKLEKELETKEVDKKYNTQHSLQTTTFKSVEQNTPVHFQATTEKTSTVSNTKRNSLIKKIDFGLKKPFLGFILTSITLLSLFSLYKFITLPQSSSSFQNMRLSKVTFDGNVGSIVTISPDGKYVAYVNQESEEESLWVRQVATSSNLQLIKPEKDKYQGLTFTPDGNYIYFTLYEIDKSKTLYKIPVLGGKKEKVLENVNRKITFSPDGSQFAFKSGEDSLMIANADGSSMKKIATCQNKIDWDYIVWNPNKESIIGSAYSQSDYSYHLVEISITDGKVKRLFPNSWISINDIAWLSDGSGLILSGREFKTKLSQIWFISYPQGTLRRVTNDLNNYLGASLTKDNKDLASIQYQRLINVWTSSQNQDTKILKVLYSVGKDEGISGIALTPDGRIIYTVKETGTLDLWIINPDGSNKKQLTNSEKSDIFPTVSPDGKYVVFSSDRAGNTNLWRMDLNGENLIQLTYGSGSQTAASFSPDGRWIVYQQFDRKTNDPITVWRVSITGGTPIQISKEPTSRPLFTLDGKNIICFYKSLDKNTPMKLALIPFEGGKPIKFFDYPLIIKSGTYRWTSDGKSLVYVDNRNQTSNLWRQPLDNSPPQKLTDFTTDRIYLFDWVNDRFVFTRGKEFANVVKINNFMNN